jgi:hypothetical protein
LEDVAGTFLEGDGHLGVAMVLLRRGIRSVWIAQSCSVRDESSGVDRVCLLLVEWQCTWEKHRKEEKKAEQ